MQSKTVSLLAMTWMLSADAAVACETPGGKAGRVAAENEETRPRRRGAPHQRVRNPLPSAAQGAADARGHRLGRAARLSSHRCRRRPGGLGDIFSRTWQHCSCRPWCRLANAVRSPCQLRCACGRLRPVRYRHRQGRLYRSFPRGPRFISKCGETDRRSIRSVCQSRTKRLQLQIAGLSHGLTSGERSKQVVQIECIDRLLLSTNRPSRTWDLLRCVASRPLITRPPVCSRALTECVSPCTFLQVS